MLDLVLAAVATAAQARRPGRPDRTSSPARSTSGSTSSHVRPEPLDQRPCRRHHNQRRTPGIAFGRSAHPPQQPQAPAHGLDTRTDPLERQRLPGGEQVHLVAQEGARDRGPGARHRWWSARPRPSGGGDDRTASPASTKARDGSGTASRADDDPARDGDGLITGEERGEGARGSPWSGYGRSEPPDLPLNRFIATAAPSPRIASTASAASCTTTASSSRSALDGRRRT